MGCLEKKGLGQSIDKKENCRRFAKENLWKKILRVVTMKVEECLSGSVVKCLALAWIMIPGYWEPHVGLPAQPIGLLLTGQETRYQMAST